MARKVIRKRKNNRITGNPVGNNTDTWSNGAKEQLSLFLGTDGHEAYADHQRELENEKRTDDFHVQYFETIEEDVKKRHDNNASMEKKHTTEKIKFRRYMSKVVQESDIQSVLDNADLDLKVTGGLGTTISDQDELYNDAVSADEFFDDVIKDYKKVVEKKVRDVPMIKHPDGTVEEKELSPGLSKLNKCING